MARLHPETPVSKVAKAHGDFASATPNRVRDLPSSPSHFQYFVHKQAMSIKVTSSPPKSSGESQLSVKPPPVFREGREFPYKLKQSCSVYLEDRQFLDGFRLLNSILTSGTSTPYAPPALVPPPSYFELAATLIVHPLYTTRAKSDEDLRASDEALHFLRDSCRLVGPINANLASAFQFRSARAAQARDRRRKRKRDHRSDGVYGESATNSEGESVDASEELDSTFVGEKSVFAQQHGSGSFWDVVGWAFNCSVKHPKRWARWKLWLDVMLDVLEEDFENRYKVVTNEEDVSGPHSEAYKKALAKFLRECLIMQYLDGAGGGRGGRRRIVSSILANGSEKAMRDFGEVWKNETRERKVVDPDEALREERKKVNLDENEWGDYDFKEDEDELAEADEDHEMDDASEDSVESFGGVESIKLRQRLLMLLVFVANSVPQHFTDREELFDVYTEMYRTLPLPVFEQFLTTAILPPFHQNGLLVNLLLPFLAAPPKHIQIFHMTQDHIIRDFFPHAANGTSAPENAKMSLLIEHLLLNLQADGRLEPNAQLRTALQKGIQARNKKAIGDARRRGKGERTGEQAAKAMLEMSAERIMLTLELLDPNATAAGAQLDGAMKLDLPSFGSSQLSDPPDDGSETEDDDGDDTITGFSRLR